MLGSKRSDAVTETSLAAVKSQTDKIDGAASDGLDGVYHSISYRMHEAERHLHSSERWLGVAVTPNGEVHVADVLGVGVSAFQVDAGDNDWGAWVQILGSSDTPVDTGKVYYDLHRLVVVSSERNVVYFVQTASGESGDVALAAGDYADIVFKPISNQIDSGPITIQTVRYTVGVKVWARCLCPGENTATLDFFFGLHEYEG